MDRNEPRPLPAPRVIVLTVFDRVPRRHVRFSRANVMTRDGFTCQYCGERPPRSQLNLDHVIPRAHGGRSTLGERRRELSRLQSPQGRAHPGAGRPAPAARTRRDRAGRRSRRFRSRTSATTSGDPSCAWSTARPSRASRGTRRPGAACPDADARTPAGAHRADARGRHGSASGRRRRRQGRRRQDAASRRTSRPRSRRPAAAWSRSTPTSRAPTCTPCSASARRARASPTSSPSARRDLRKLLVDTPIPGLRLIAGTHGHLGAPQPRSFRRVALLRRAAQAARRLRAASISAPARTRR